MTNESKKRSESEFEYVAQMIDAKDEKAVEAACNMLSDMSFVDRVRLYKCICPNIQKVGKEMSAERDSMLISIAKGLGVDYDAKFHAQVRFAFRHVDDKVPTAHKGVRLFKM